MINEIWKAIPGFGDHYEASSLGNIRVKQRVIVKPHSRSGKLCEYIYPERLLSAFKNKRGYVSVHIGVDKVKVTLQVHRAVLLAFVGPPPEGFEACHCNGNPSDNRIENLRWDSHLENNRDRLIHGTYALGEKHAMNRYAESDIRAIQDGRWSHKEAVARIGISTSQFYRVRAGRAWRHLLAGQG